MSNKRKLNKQKLPWGTLGESTSWEPFGDCAPDLDWNGERLTLDEADYKAITAVLWSRAQMRLLQRG